MTQNIREYVENKLPREDDKKLFRDLLDAYSQGGPDEVKSSIKELIRNLSRVQ